MQSSAFNRDAGWPAERQNEIALSNWQIPALEAAVEALIASFDRPDDPPFDESWREVVRRRSDEIKSGRVTPIPWEEVKRQVRGSSGA